MGRATCFSVRLVACMVVAPLSPSVTGGPDTGQVQDAEAGDYSGCRDREQEPRSQTGARQPAAVRRGSTGELQGGNGASEYV